MLLKRIRFVVFFIYSNIFVTVGYAQNLVLNGGFETAAECPLTSRYDFFSKGPCKDWSCPPNGTPDYYSFSCAFGGSSTTTNNSNPQEGKAFAGMYVYGNWGNMFNREYISGKLSQTLLKDHTYFVKFYIKPLLSDRFSISAAVEKLGIHFSNKMIKTTDQDLLLRVNPQIINYKSAINDTTGWTEISGCFTAKGDENYFILGNFFSDAESKVKSIKGSTTSPTMGYLLVDNVSVEEISKTQLITDNEALICSGDSIKIQINKGNFDKTVWWDLNTNISLFFNKSGIYSVTANYKNTCTIYDSIKIIEKNCTRCNFYLPTAFTPDDNTRNEVFHLESNCVTTLIRMRIYNRWGELVFDGTGEKPEWDGTYLGNRAQEGLYVYLCEVIYEYQTQIKREVLQGTATLLR